MRKYTNICRFKTSRYFSKVFRIAIRVCKHVLIFFFSNIISLLFPKIFDLSIIRYPHVQKYLFKTQDSLRTHKTRTFHHNFLYPHTFFFHKTKNPYALFLHTSHISKDLSISLLTKGHHICRNASTLTCRRFSSDPRREKPPRDAQNLFSLQKSNVSMFDI